MKILYFLGLFFVIFITGCASTGKSIATGSTIGAAAGTVFGAALYPINTKKGVFRGALIGATVGGLLGLTTHKWLGKRDAKIRRDTILKLGNSDILNTPWNKESPPTITKPIIEGRWVEPKIKGKKLIEGHKEWRIAEESKWVFPQDIEQGEENGK